MTRFYTVPDAKTARRSRGMGDVSCRRVLLPGRRCSASPPQTSSVRMSIRAADKGGNLTLPLLAQYLGGGKSTFGGDLMLGFVAAVAIATILAVVSGLTLSTSGAIAHDFYDQLGQAWAG